jgi:hypothetical protein
MATIITREIGATAKGSPLTNQEFDNNLININTQLNAVDAKANSTALSGVTLSDGFYTKNLSDLLVTKESAINAEALHRSPNAVTAMFVYDTSKDSDGGAWTAKCQHTSWYNEPLNGKWLGAQLSETDARYVGATVGNELLVNSTFDTSISGWTPTSYIASSVSGGFLTLTTLSGAAYSDGISQTITGLTIGKSYLLRVVLGPSSTVRLRFVTGYGQFYTNMTLMQSFVATSTSLTVYAYVDANTANQTASIDSISVREVTALNTATGDYFQLTTDGKFYRLWRNLIQSSEVASTFSAYIKGGSISETSAVSPPTGLSKVFAFTESTGASSTHYSCIIIPQTGTLNSVGSVYVKAGSRSVISFGVGGGLGVTAKFDFASGLFISNTASVVATSVGNGWWRFSQAYE